MDEADWYTIEPPILSEELIANIVEVLGLEDPESIDHLDKRLRRYADRYYSARKRQRFKETPGEVRKIMKQLDARLAKVEDDLRHLAFYDEAMDAYRAVRREESGKDKPSLEGAMREVAGLRSVCAKVFAAPPHKAGQKGRPRLRHAVGSFMALFETITGERPRCAASQGADKGDFLVGRCGIALRMVFETIDPNESEAAIARMVKLLEEQFEGRPMREGMFDIISAMEDTGEILVEFVQNQ